MKVTFKIFIGSIILISCYSNYVNLKYEVFGGAQWNSARNQVAFIASTCVFQRAEGISRFPDGGVPNYLKKDVALYLYSENNFNLSEILEFKDLAELLGPNRSKYKVHLAFADSLIYYQLKSLSDWKYYIKDSSAWATAKKYDRFYCYNLSSNVSNEVDSLEFFSIYNKLEQSNKIGLSEFNKKLSVIPLSDWGLILQDIYPKSNNAYIEETIYLKNNDKTARLAVVEQIIAPMSAEEISEILKKMEKHAAALQGTDKQNYDLFGRETYEKIHEILEYKKSAFR